MTRHRGRWRSPSNFKILSPSPQSSFLCHRHRHRHRRVLPLVTVTVTVTAELLPLSPSPSPSPPSSSLCHRHRHRHRWPRWRWRVTVATGIEKCNLSIVQFWWECKKTHTLKLSWKKVQILSLEFRITSLWIIIEKDVPLILTKIKKLYVVFYSCKKKCTSLVSILCDQVGKL